MPRPATVFPSAESPAENRWAWRTEVPEWKARTCVRILKKTYVMAPLGGLAERGANGWRAAFRGARATGEVGWRGCADYRARSWRDGSQKNAKIPERPGGTCFATCLVPKPGRAPFWLR